MGATLDAVKLAASRPSAALDVLRGLLGRPPYPTLVRLTSASLDEVKALRHAYYRSEFCQTSREHMDRAPSPTPILKDAELYVLTRLLEPRVVLETGVAGGLSSGAFLQGMHDNGQGRLYSIDLPDEVIVNARGRRSRVRPPGTEPGWLVPASLRDPWTLLLGRSQDLLPELLSKLAYIDFFLHDSFHSYECMEFEFRTVWPYLRPRGLLMADDILWNRAFLDFSRVVGRRPHFLDPVRTAILQK